MKNIIFTLLVLFSFNIYAQEPMLPMGLGDDDEKVEKSSEPVLPAGLFGDDNGQEENSFASPLIDDEDTNWVFNGFVEGRYGRRVKDQNYQRNTSISETRLQTDIEYDGEKIKGKFVTDFIYDDVMEYTKQNLETGDGYIDLREASLQFQITNYMDIKVGRQTLTWGVGDLLFINDFFPKDWNAFFTGRDVEYLKAPSDALKTSIFMGVFNLDFVYTPRHDASRYIDGRRISFYSPTLMRPSGMNDPAIEAEERNDWFNEDEIALRAYKNIGSAEIALYYFDGYWKTPEGQDAMTGNYIFPELKVYGASARTPFASGILSLETGFYDTEDSAGDNQYLRNSEWRYMIGYEQELMKNFTAGIQFYSEIIENYDAYLSTLPVDMIAKDEVREVWTLRLTQMLMNQKIILSLFNYYSPSDEDGYVRPKVTYKSSDALMFEVGGNFFWGEKDLLNNSSEEQTTFFGQFEDNNNIFGAVRYTF